MTDHAMTLDDTPAQAAFRREARAWVDDNAPKALEPLLRQSAFASLKMDEADLLVEARAWQARKSRDGWACLAWPNAYGGRDASPIERVIWAQEEGLYAALSSPFLIGQGMCGPTLMAHGDAAVRAEHLPPLASGERIWCQLFSEPAAGSDLAGVRTRAVRDGDDWIVQGQKVWTSGAHYSDFGILLARTDPAAPKHRGLTMFYLDMRSPGVEVRPIHQATGRREFNEVFFSGARIPDRQRLGAAGDGWKVALTTLMNERLSIGASMPTGFAEFVAYLRGLERLDDPVLQARLVDWHCRTNGLKYTTARLITALGRGDAPGPEASIGKLVAASTMQEIAAAAIDVQGTGGLVVDPFLAAAAGQFQAMLMRSQGGRIEGGTDEILRNIIAERVLGLPPEPRVDKDIPFDQAAL